MQLQVPFFANTGDGKQCMQVAMQSVLKHFLNKDFSLEELDAITGRHEGQWTWTVQSVPALHELGLKVKYYSTADVVLSLRPDAYVREILPDDAEKVLGLMNVEAIRAAVKSVLKYQLFSQKRISVQELEQFLDMGVVPIVLIDYNEVVPRFGGYHGHFITLTGYDADHVFYHESGPTEPMPHRRLTKDVFLRAWSASGTDNDVVLVFGAR